MALYREASRILKLIENKSGNLKELIFSSGFKNKRQLYALVIETLKHSQVLQEILDTTGILHKDKSLKGLHLAKSLLYDYLFGKGLMGNSAIEQAILSHSPMILATKEKLMGKIQISEQGAALPRYVRVNTLKMTVETAVNHYVDKGFHLKVFDQLDRSSYLNCVQSLKESEFSVDADIPELLVFPPKTDLHEDSLYRSGCIILQDKASCLPAIVLNPSENSHIIDCCAAPGNKTSLMAALINNNGTIFAFDKSNERLTTLKTLCEKVGASCVNASNKDFLRINPQDSRYRNVEYILVDPSCSGSGITNRSEIFCNESGPSAARLRSLANFQAMILSHALSFPNVRRVVYSTCSIHKEENEDVVLEVIMKYKDRFRLVHILPQFDSRGDGLVFGEAAKCVRLNPDNNLTNGFFISCFERTCTEADCSLGGKLSDSVAIEKEGSSSELNPTTCSAGKNVMAKSRKEGLLAIEIGEEKHIRDKLKLKKLSHKSGKKRRKNICPAEKSESSVNASHQNSLINGMKRSFSNCAQSSSEFKRKQKHKRPKGFRPPVTWNSTLSHNT